jgi:predicted RNA polymerase sigma factor
MRAAQGKVRTGGNPGTFTTFTDCLSQIRLHAFPRRFALQAKSFLGAKPYALQAAIAACHMRARTAGETDWDRIVLLYDALLQVNPSPIVALNRAVAVGMVQGPAAGLDALDAAATLAGDSALAGYHLFPSVRGDLLMKMGRLSEAREEIQRAIAMTKNLREQELLANRLKQLEKADSSE